MPGSRPLAPLALALGAFLDEALDGERAEPVLGLLAGTGTMVVARDLFLAPEEIASLHVLTKVKWPPQLRIGPRLPGWSGFVVAAGHLPGPGHPRAGAGQGGPAGHRRGGRPCASAWNAGW